MLCLRAAGRISCGSVWDLVANEPFPSIGELAKRGRVHQRIEENHCTKGQRQATNRSQACTARRRE
jgi:hypothetical protein